MDKWTDCASNQTPTKMEPIVYLNTEMYDIKSWLSPYISKFHGHTGPHAFHITRDSNDEAVFKWKTWSSVDEEWKPDGAGLKIFTVSLFLRIFLII